MNLISRRSVSIISLCFFLALLVLWQATSPVRLPIPVQPSRSSDNPAAEGSAAAAPAPRAETRGAYTEIDQRPLFVSTRKLPPPVPQVATTPPPKTLEQYSVVGIVAAPSRSTAIIRGPAGAMIHLRVGQPLEGWTLETIEQKKITFASGEQHQDLELKTNKLHQDSNELRTNKGITMSRPALAPGLSGASSQ